MSLKMGKKSLPPWFTFSKGEKKSGVGGLSSGLEALANLLKERGAEIFIGAGGSDRFPASLAGSPAEASLNVPSQPVLSAIQAKTIGPNAGGGGKWMGKVNQGGKERKGIARRAGGRIKFL
jgi:hypothetical protein